MYIYIYILHALAVALLVVCRACGGRAEHVQRACPGGRIQGHACVPLTSVAVEEAGSSDCT